MITNSLTEFFSLLPEHCKLMGIDYGEARIGIATCDVMHMIASPHSTYHRRNMRQDMGHLNALMNEESVKGIVMGLPLAMDGTENEACETVRHFAQKLEKKSAIPILFWDERLSTQAVTRSLSEYNFSRRKAQSVDDKLAATYILQQVLDSKNRR